MAQIVIAELRPRLQACCVFLTTETGLLSCKIMKISIKPTSIDISWLSKSCSELQKIILPSCILVPNSLSCLYAEDGFVSFRVQTEPVIGLVGSFSTEVIPFSSQCSDKELVKITSVVANIASNSNCQISCRCCGHKLANNSVKRILPLPSSALDFTEWFCHGHGHGSSFCMAPLQGDILYGNCYFVVRQEWLAPTALRSDVNRVARCKRCLAWLGTNTSSRVMLWDCTVCVGDCSLATPLQDFVKSVAQTIACCVGPMCRVVVETQLTENEKHYLLLWIVDKNLQVLTNSKSGESLCSCENHTFVKTLLKPRNTVKLLYLYQSDCSSIVKTWQGDLNVQSIQVAKSMFTEGLEHLQKMTKCIPHPYRFSSNYFTAYLEI